MSKKKGEIALMLPGSEGWEIWSGSSANGFTKAVETEFQFALEVDKFPSGSLCLALPVRQVVALPFKAQTDDLSLLGDLATMHLERHGVRPALDGGELADYFVYASEGTDSILTPVVLNPPVEGELPRRSPDAFDLSARCLPLPAGKVAVWRELGRWVFALGDGERLLYFQCLPSSQLDERAGRDVRLALTQLQLQGLIAEIPDQLTLWVVEGASNPRPIELQAFSRGAGIDLAEVPKPAPHWPSPPSRLLPADVRAERVEAKNRRNRNLAIAAALIAYLGVFVFFFQKYREADKKAIALERQVQQLGPETEILLQHEDKWSELAPVVESEFHPLEVFHRVVTAAPRDPSMPLRIVQATILNDLREQDGVANMSREIMVRGNAAESKHVGDFNLKLNQSEELQEFRWITPSPKRGKSGRWEFTYNATTQPEQGVN